MNIFEKSPVDQNETPRLSGDKLSTNDVHPIDDERGNVEVAAKRDAVESSEKAASLLEKIKRGMSKEGLRRSVEAFALGAALIGGAPAQAEVVPDAPRPEMMKKSAGEQEKRLIFSRNISDLKYGNFFIEVNFVRGSDQTRPDFSYEVKINGQLRNIIKGHRMRDGLMAFDIEGVVPNTFESIYVPGLSGSGRGEKSKYTIVDPNTKEKVVLILDK